MICNIKMYHAVTVMRQHQKREKNRISDGWNQKEIYGNQLLYMVV